jgi:sulfur carrier protein
VTITINGEARETAAATLLDVFREYTSGLDIEEPKGFAIALNGALARKTKWADTPVSPGDSVEIVRPMQGG